MPFFAKALYHFGVVGIPPAGGDVDPGHGLSAEVTIESSYFLRKGFFVQVGGGVEDFRGDFAGGGVPIADDFTVLEEHRPEDTAVVVGAVAVVGMEGDVAAFVADEVFVVRRKKMRATASESADSAVLMKVKIQTFPALANQL